VVFGTDATRFAITAAFPMPLLDALRDKRLAGFGRPHRAVSARLDDNQKPLGATGM